jgi:hypothetical protein
MQIVHPLSEVHPPSKDIPEETINLWGAASIIVDEVRKNNNTALTFFKSAIFSFNPSVDFEAMLLKIKAGDTATIMLAINWTKESMQAELDKHFQP